MQEQNQRVLGLGIEVVARWQHQAIVELLALVVGEDARLVCLLRLGRATRQQTKDDREEKQPPKLKCSHG